MWWWSTQSGKKNRTKAVFVEDDRDFPVEDVILAIKGNTFRWPRKLTAPIEE